MTGSLAERQWRQDVLFPEEPRVDEPVPREEEPEYRTCFCGPDGQEHWHTIPPRRTGRRRG
jgi:hypothetical protein